MIKKSKLYVWRHTWSLDPSSFHKLSLSQALSLVWSVAYFMDASSNLYKASFSDSWLKLFCAHPLLRPNPGAFLMLGPQIGIVFHCSTTLHLEILSLSPLQLLKRLKAFMLMGLSATDAVWESCWLEWAISLGYFIRLHKTYITLRPLFFSLTCGLRTVHFTTFILICVDIL